MRLHALGADVVASKRHGPFEPPPPYLRWLSSDNDRVLREADVVAVTVSGGARGLINATSLGLMKEGALLVPISAGVEHCPPTFPCFPGVEHCPPLPLFPRARRL